MSTDLPPNRRTTRFYTAVRRIPILVGKLPNGGFIFGGPYTLLQVALMITVGAGGFYTMPMWSGQDRSLGNFAKLAVAIVITVMVSRKIRWRGRQALPALRGTLHSYSRGAQPRQAGRLPNARGPQRISNGSLILEQEPAGSAARTIPADARRAAAHPEPTTQIAGRGQRRSEHRTDVSKASGPGAASRPASTTQRRPARASNHQLMPLPPRPNEATHTPDLTARRGR